MSVNQLVSYCTDASDVWIKTMFVLSPFRRKRIARSLFLIGFADKKDAK